MIGPNLKMMTKQGVVLTIWLTQLDQTSKYNLTVM